MVSPASVKIPVCPIVFGSHVWLSRFDFSCFIWICLYMYFVWDSSFAVSYMYLSFVCLNGWCHNCYVRSKLIFFSSKIFLRWESMRKWLQLRPPRHYRWPWHGGTGDSGTSARPGRCAGACGWWRTHSRHRISRQVTSPRRSRLCKTDVFVHRRTNRLSLQNIAIS